MCQDLRVLNSIRDYQIGIPLTFTQYPPWGRQEGRLWSLAGSANPLPSVPALAGELGCNGMGRSASDQPASDQLAPRCSAAACTLGPRAGSASCTHCTLLCPAPCL